MTPLITDAGEQTFVLTYDKNDPAKFRRSVNSLARHFEENQDTKLGEYTGLYFENAEKEIIANEYDQTLALSIEIAQDPANKDAYIKLCRTIVDRMEHEGQLDYIEDWRNHGEDLMFGLIELGSGSHSEIIEDWLLNIDWSHIVYQDEVIFKAIEKWGITEYSLRLGVIAYAFCNAQPISSTFEESVEPISQNPDTWDGFANAALVLRSKWDSQERYKEIDTRIILSNFDDISDINTQTMLQKASMVLTNTVEECFEFFKRYTLHQRSTPQQLMGVLKLWHIHFAHDKKIENLITKMSTLLFGVFESFTADQDQKEQLYILETIKTGNDVVAELIVQYYTEFVSYHISNKIITEDDNTTIDSPLINTQDKTLTLNFDNNNPAILESCLADLTDAFKDNTFRFTFDFCIVVNCDNQLISDQNDAFEALSHFIKTTDQIDNYINLVYLIVDKMDSNEVYKNNEFIFAESLLNAMFVNPTNISKDYLSDIYRCLNVWLLKLAKSKSIEHSHIDFSSIGLWGKYSASFESMVLINTFTSNVSEQSMYYKHLHNTLMNKDIWHIYCQSAIDLKYELINYNHEHQNEKGFDLIQNYMIEDAPFEMLESLRFECVTQLISSTLEFNDFLYKFITHTNIHPELLTKHTILWAEQTPKSHQKLKHEIEMKGNSFQKHLNEYNDRSIEISQAVDNLYKAFRRRSNIKGVTQDIINYFTKKIENRHLAYGFELIENPDDLYFDEYQLSFQKGNAQLLNASIAKLIHYCSTNPDFSFEDETNIKIVDENEEVLLSFEDGAEDCSEFDEYKAFWIEQARSPYCKQYIIQLAEMITQKRDPFGYEGYMYTEHSQGEDIMYGLIELGDGPHIEIIENWLMTIDWDHSCDQHDVVFNAIKQLGLTSYTHRLAFVMMTICHGQQGSDYFNDHFPEILNNPLVWDDFCQNALAFKNKYIALKSKYDDDEINNLTEYLNLASSKSNAVNLNYKLVSTLIDNTEDMYTFFKDYYDDTTEDPETIITFLNKWFKQVKSIDTRGLAREEIAQVMKLKNKLERMHKCFITTLDVIDYDATPDKKQEQLLDIKFGNIELAEEMVIEYLKRYFYILSRSFEKESTDEDVDCEFLDTDNKKIIVHYDVNNAYVFIDCIKSFKRFFDKNQDFFFTSDYTFEIKENDNQQIPVSSKGAKYYFTKIAQTEDHCYSFHDFSNLIVSHMNSNELYSIGNGFFAHEIMHGILAYSEVRTFDSLSPLYNWLLCLSKRHTLHHSLFNFSKCVNWGNNGPTANVVLALMQFKSNPSLDGMFVKHVLPLFDNQFETSNFVYAAANIKNTIYQSNTKKAIDDQFESMHNNMIHAYKHDLSQQLKFDIQFNTMTSSNEFKDYIEKYLSNNSITTESFKTLLETYIAGFNETNFKIKLLANNMLRALTMFDKKVQTMSEQSKIIEYLEGEKKRYGTKKPGFDTAYNFLIAQNIAFIKPSVPYEEQYYLVNKYYGEHTLTLMATNNTARRIKSDQEIEEHGGPLLYENAYKQKDKERGHTHTLQPVHMNIDQLIINNHIYSLIKDFPTRSAQLYPSIIIDDNDQYNGGYWLLNIYEKLDILDVERSEIDKEDNDDANRLDIKKFALNHSALDEIKEDERLVINIDRLNRCMLFMHQKMVDILEAEGIDTLKFFKLSEYRAGDQFNNET